MTIPNPTEVLFPCRATHVSGQRVVPCTRRGAHDRHINYRANVAWS